MLELGWRTTGAAQLNRLRIQLIDSSTTGLLSFSRPESKYASKQASERASEQVTKQVVNAPTDSKPFGQLINWYQSSIEDGLIDWSSSLVLHLVSYLFFNFILKLEIRN